MNVNDHTYNTSYSATPPSHAVALAAVGNAAPGEIDLQAVLALWQTATDRLQKTHETLRSEVRRLSDELEIKNRELARQNRLADLGQMAAHVAHEVRNSLAPVTLYMSLLRRRVAGDAASLDVMQKIEACFQALEVTVTDLLNFTSDRDPVRQDVDVVALIEDVCESLAPQLAAQHIRTTVEAPPDARIAADQHMLRRALLNLVINAIDAMPTGGELVITAVADDRGVELEVADSGPGIPENVRRRMFEPFFTTKSEGTGLGLAIVQRIAEAHGGQLIVANCAEGGAAFTLRIPEHTGQILPFDTNPKRQRGESPTTPQTNAIHASTPTTRKAA